MDHSFMPVMKALKNHKHKNSVSFHVPGHKNGLLGPWMDLSFDVTELTGLDDLHAPEECIAEAENMLSDVYKTVESKFLINGSTIGNLAMILGTLSKGDTVFVQRNCHKSVLNALKMAEAFLVFLAPDVDERTQTATLISVETLQEAYAAYPNSKAVIFTYPTYYGMTGSFQELAIMAKSHGSWVLVDEAHGAHFRANGKGVPMSALQLGADIVVQSAHKMLPAMTMGAYLHIQSERIDRGRIHFYLQALQSSSPSYPIMASLDYARSYLALYTEKDHAYSMDVKKRIVQLLESKGFICITVDDPYKLLVRVEGLTGYNVQELFEAVGVYIELADPCQVLLVFPLLKAGEVLFEEYAAGKLSVLQVKGEKEAVSFPRDFQSERVSVLALPYNEHSCYRKTAVSFEEAAGEVSAEMIIPYPPGIPLVMEGERISSGHIQMIQWLMEQGSRFHGGSGLNEQKIVVFRKES
ncbi:aminotransferase class I/II-fold pyridoxal phosphate-dependent enzyme [Domibacillus sp. A3M-37]|uniref:aminotransferase class I/II-fold pyridoxal phosphate-dependent enzyme n=1 Tax=Domibacillus sp. A3M-37 TaxID=2962037 RepID=UPI0020B727F9|nr:aminotransferase class I/II-fold pyridoxal phosphate-dependent enzyme [Domibacillus sp. A3M-37]MCP3764480.1 aminotransferase class I/II-fold pyridoxal phosphate-dependent enzyme [Domibacillus sp. A3M-37]